MMLKNKWIPVLSVLGVAAGLQLLSFTARADARPELTDIVKDADGRIRLMNQYDAESYCRNEGSRLPTARELALESQRLGAQGISETPKDGYYLVKDSDGATNPDHFYFSYKGYERPAGELGDHWFWSSSVSPYYAYLLNGDHGGIGLNDRSTPYGAVRCMRLAGLAFLQNQMRQ
jgi:hypothetical protein